jgi:pimeloyl-ACP methyl ester carboxylesterase
VDASPDLTQWTRQTTLLRTNGNSSSLYWQDTNGATGTARFYRTPTNYLITQFPIASGPYAVGKIVRILTDPTRTNRYDIPTNSSFMCTIWYPCNTPAAGNLPAPYTDYAVATDLGLYSGLGWPLQWENIIAACVGQACTNVPVATGTNRFPVIVHSHGAGCDRTCNTGVSLELASHGYIVAAVDHIDCHCTVFPDSRGVCYSSVPISAALVQSRTNDMESLLGTLSQFDSADPILAGRLDLQRIGAMGWSLGGATAAELARSDERITCAALLDPYIDATNDPTLATVGLQKPFLTMNDTVPIHQDFLPPPNAFTTMSSNLFTLSVTNATWFEVANASHTTFSDWGWAMDAGPDTRSAAVAINTGTLWFFDTYLKGQTPPFPTNAEIMNLNQK